MYTMYFVVKKKVEFTSEYPSSQSFSILSTRVVKLVLIPIPNFNSGSCIVQRSETVRVYEEHFCDI